jgi:enoyl-CoA hydratase
MVDYSRYRHIKVEKQNRIAVLTLNRPEVLNAVNMELHAELEDVFGDVARDEEVNAVVLTGAGRGFCAGGDVKTMDTAQSQPSARTPLSGFRRLIHNMLEVEQPIIAALNGDAVGLGATIALFCDIIFAAENARIGDTHVKVGLVAGDGGAVIWPMLVGLPKAKELLLTGDLITAKEAERIGLVNRVVSLEELYPEVMGLANRLASGPSRAIRWTKLALNKRLREEVNLVLDASLAVEALSMTTEDHKEAVRAFIEKRAPQFKGI